jgi:hypothetical protein
MVWFVLDTYTNKCEKSKSFSSMKSKICGKKVAFGFIFYKLDKDKFSKEVKC